MKTFKKIDKECSFFLKLSFTYFFIATFFLLLFSRVNGFILLNSFHTELLNRFFSLITFFGDGLFIISLSVFIFFFYKKHRLLALIILISYFSSGIFSGILKNLISAPRPAEYFKIHHLTTFSTIFLNNKIGFTSFPSGHTASFFALATVIVNYFKRKNITIIAFLLSVLVGYSRIYLAHHFLIDVLFGSIIGLSFGFLSQNWSLQIVQSTFITKVFKSKSIHFKDSQPIHS